VLVWLPLLIWCERLRAREYGLWPGLALRLAAGRLDSKLLVEEIDAESSK
jgi:hypothetical protein